MHPPIAIIVPFSSLCFFSSPNLPNNLSSAFSLTQQVLKITKSASSITSVFSYPSFSVIPDNFSESFSFN